MKQKSVDELRQLKYDQKIDLYRQRAKALSAQSKGLEYFCYKVFGYNLIGSLAFALDPKWQISDNPYKGDGTPFQIIQPVSRDRYRLAYPQILQAMPFKSTVRLDTGGWRFDPISWSWVFITSSDTTTYYDATVTGSVQPTLYASCWDTTRKLRAPFMEQGEFESFQPRLYSKYDGRTFVSDTQSYFYDDYTKTYGVASAGPLYGPIAIVLPAYSDAVRGSEEVFALDLMAKNADGLYARALPTHRNFNLGYQLGELKDLPETLRGSLKILIEVRRIFGKPWKLLTLSKDPWTKEFIKKVYPHLSSIGFWKSLPKSAGDAYLTFKFGWQSMLQALGQLASTPPKIAKRVNYLIKRQGQASSFHSQIEGQMKLSDSPFTTWFVPPNESPDLSIETSGSPISEVDGLRTYSLRCTLNAFVNLPNVSVPILREQLIVDFLGLKVEPQDIYDLIPWTWLLDWFNGLGDYVHCFAAVNKDKSLINWGLLSYHSRVRIHQAIHLVASDTKAITHIPGTSFTEVTPRRHDVGAVFEADFRLRKDMSHFTTSAKYTSTLLNLDDEQQSIIGALLTKFT